LRVYALLLEESFIHQGLIQEFGLAVNVTLKHNIRLKKDNRVSRLKTTCIYVYAVIRLTIM